MTPLSFEWHWQADYFIFMGLLYLALAIIGAGVLYTYIRTWFDLDKPKKRPETDISYRGKYTDY
jgi:hypothetical protein